MSAIAAVAPASAQAPASAPPPGGAQDGQEARPWSWADLGIKGTLTYKGFAHFEEAPNENRRFRNEGILELEWERKLGEAGRLRLAGDLRGDDDEFADGVHFQIPETTKRRSLLNLKEAVLRLGGERLQVSLGKQIYSWGTADAVNPTDYLNPYDFLDVLDRQKLGVYAAAYSVTSGPLSQVFVIVPVFTPSRDQRARSRWALQAQEGFVGILDDRELPETTAGHMQYATRLRGTFKGADVSLSYFDGYDSTPVLRQAMVSAGFFQVQKLTPVYTRLKAVGADVSTTWRKFEFHAEGAAKFVESHGRDDRFQWVAGLNYTFDELPVKWLERIETILEYSWTALSFGLASAANLSKVHPLVPNVAARKPDSRNSRSR